MNISQDLLDRINALESQVNKSKYHLTLLPGHLLKRDLNTNEIEYILDDGEGFFDAVLLVNTAMLEPWEEVSISPEKCWLLEHIHPGKTAEKAWNIEVKKYNKEKAERIANFVEPADFYYGEIKEHDGPEYNPIKRKKEAPITETAEERMARVQAQIAKDFYDDELFSL